MQNVGECLWKNEIILQILSYFILLFFPLMNIYLYLKCWHSPRGKSSTKRNSIKHKRNHGTKLLTLTFNSAQTFRFLSTLCTILLIQKGLRAAETNFQFQKILFREGKRDSTTQFFSNLLKFFSLSIVLSCTEAYKYV